MEHGASANQFVNIERELSRDEQGSIADGDPGIEPGIKPLVVSLRFQNFNTTGSCEGHECSCGKAEQPYVVICAKWYNSDDGPEDWDQAQIDWSKEVARLQAIIDQYNTRQGIPQDAIRMRINTSKLPGWSALEFIGSTLDENRKLVLDFSDFLRTL